MGNFIVTKEVVLNQAYTAWFLSPEAKITTTIFDDFKQAFAYMKEEILFVNGKTKSKANGLFPCRAWCKEVNDKDKDIVMRIDELLSQTLFTKEFVINDVNFLDLRKTDEINRSYAFLANRDILLEKFKGVTYQTNIHNVNSTKKAFYFDYVKYSGQLVTKQVKIRLVPENVYYLNRAVIYPMPYFETMNFGQYWQDKDGATKTPVSWMKLSDANGKTVLISEKIIDCRQFDKSSTEWRQSDLRAWLNNEFYNECFSAEEKLRIIADSEGDNISLLSLEDYVRYFPERRAAVCMKTPYAVMAKKHSLFMEDAFWWLKTKSKQEKYLCHVCCDGTINPYERHDFIDGVRPVIIIDCT